MWYEYLCFGSSHTLSTVAQPKRFSLVGLLALEGLLEFLDRVARDRPLGAGLGVLPEEHARVERRDAPARLADLLLALAVPVLLLRDAHVLLVVAALVEQLPAFGFLPRRDDDDKHERAVGRVQQPGHVVGHALDDLRDERRVGLEAARARRELKEAADAAERKVRVHERAAETRVARVERRREALHLAPEAAQQHVEALFVQRRLEAAAIERVVPQQQRERRGLERRLLALVERRDPALARIQPAQLGEVRAAQLDARGAVREHAHVTIVGHFDALLVRRRQVERLRREAPQLLLGLLRERLASLLGAVARRAGLAQLLEEPRVVARGVRDERVHLGHRELGRELPGLVRRVGQLVDAHLFARAADLLAQVAHDLLPRDLHGRRDLHAGRALRNALEQRLRQRLERARVPDRAALVVILFLGVVAVVLALGGGAVGLLGLALLRWLLRVLDLHGLAEHVAGLHGHGRQDRVQRVRHRYVGELFALVG